MDCQKIYEAVKVIKEECEKHDGEESCQECPLGKEA